VIGVACDSCSPIPVNKKTDLAIDAVCNEYRAKFRECTIMKKYLAPEEIRSAVCCAGTPSGYTQLATELQHSGT
jgi:hypothetical protein